MKTTMTPVSCPSCGSPLSPGAARGLCPRCLLAGVAGPTAPTHPRPAPPTLAEVAAAFPQFEIVALIGQGGMGAVYQVRQPKLDRFAALKLLPESLASDPAFASRFEREARLLAKLSHPGVVSVFDYGQAGGFFFLLMEFVDGVNLRQAMRAGRFTAPQALALVPRICEALQYAHDEGVLHRDIKPENILLDARGRVKLADFGIAKLMAEPASEPSGSTASLGATPSPNSSPSSAPGLTQAGAALGTPAYMAPEQRDTPSSVDHRADIYSLGVVFYELLTGELPSGAVVSPSAKCAADPRVDAIVRQALERERELRQNSADEMRTQVETVTSGAAPTSSAPSSSLLKSDRGWFTTPEHLATFTGGFVIKQGVGELTLHTNRLVLACGLERTEIPLASLAHVGPARLSRLHSPGGHRFLHLRFCENGRNREVLFRAGNGLFRNPASTDQETLEWIGAIRRACQASHGHIPPGLDKEPALVSASPWGALLCYSLAFVPACLAGWPVALGFVFFALGILAFSSLLMRRNQLSQENEPPPGIASSGPSRFSRSAIVGAAWVVLFLVFGVMWLTTSTVVVTEAGPPPPGPPIWQKIMLLTMLLLGVGAPFGTTILGWVAVSQIRNSAGRLYGLWLAIFDGLLFPLLLLDVALVYLVRGLGEGFLGWSDRLTSAQSTQLTVLSLLACLAADYFIIRAVCRKLGASFGSAEKPRHPLWPTVALHAALLALFCTALVGLLPRYIGLYQDAGVALPAATRFIINTVNLWGVMLFPLLLAWDALFCFMVRDFGGKVALRSWSISVIVGLVLSVIVTAIALLVPLQSIVEQNKTSAQNARPEAIGQELGDANSEVPYPVTFDTVTAAAKALVADSFREAEISGQTDELIVTQSLRDYVVYNASKTGEVATVASQDTGPDSQGFRLTIQRLKAPLVSQAVLPQFFDRPYWKSYGNTSFNPGTGEGIAVYFDYGAKLNSTFKERMLDLLELKGIRNYQLAKRNPVFTPDREVVLPLPAKGRPCVLDFETGAVLTPPPEVAAILERGDQALGETARHWIEKTGADAVLNPGQKELRLRLFGGTATSKSRAEKTGGYLSWTPGTVLALVDPPRKGTIFHWDDSSESFQETPFHSPAAVVFATREGGKGVMELFPCAVKVEEAPGGTVPGLRVLYKMVKLVPRQ